MNMKFAALVLAAIALTGCASKEEQMHVEGRVDSSRVMYTCSTLAQKQLAIQQFNGCYMMAPKTKANRQECEETARSLACDRLLDDKG
ncbi:hypothetical protein D3C76_78120 [compost metagenome]